MSDNTILPGTGELYAAEDQGGVKFQKVLIGASNSAAIDAFGRWRTSEPNTLFDSKLLHGDSQDLFWDEELESGTMATAGPTAAKPFIDFTSSDTTAGQRTRQTFQRFNYQPGKSQLILMTGVLELASGTKTGCERRIGPFDNDNGVFFASNEGVIQVVVRTKDTGSPVDNEIDKANWNLDVMDGSDSTSNPSHHTLDATKAQIFVFDFQWLSAGRVRFGIEIGGRIHYVHEFNAANILAVPWASTPNLPLRYQIITTTSSGVCSMRCICAAVISEGGINERGPIRYRSTAGAVLVTDTENELFCLIALRLKATHLGAHIRVVDVQLQIQTAGESLEWVLVHGTKNDVITVGGSLTYADLANSALQTALGATANDISGGTEVGGGFLETGNNAQGAASDGGIVPSTLTLGAAVDGTRSELMLAVRPNGGVSAMEVEGSITWQEID
jgi:hypothetical protein